MRARKDRCYAWPMAHVFRFHILPETPFAESLALPPEEAHHALHVVRVATGDRVTLFDGHGREIDATVAQVSHREVIVDCGEERRIEKPAVRVSIMQAWLLREKSVESVIRRGTELGVARFCFFRARHSEKTPRLNPKWERLAIETCKQCGRAWLPTFEVVSDLRCAFEAAEGVSLFATSDIPPRPLRDALHGEAASVFAGPEGDWSPEETREAQDRGVVPISLGPAVYRSEVASTLAAALVLYEWGQLGPIA